jgi:cell division protein FtsW
MRKNQKLILLKQNKGKVDWIIAVLAIFLTLFGILMIFESSNVTAFREFGDKYKFVKDQFANFSIGIIGMCMLFFISYKKYYQWSFWLMLLTIFFLIAVFIPGIGVKALGARRWLDLKFLNFQPSELTKLVLIFYLSAWFSAKEKGRLFPFLLLMSLIVGLVVLQPDLGTAVIIIGIAFILYFLAGASLWQFMLLIPAAVIAIVLLAYTSPYRFQRLTTFLNPNIDPLGSSYHIRQILISLGSGGMFGIGIGASRQKYQFLPEATTDSIFAIIGEEFGFIGSLVFIFVYLFFLFRIFKAVKHISDKFGFLLGSGIFSLFAVQTAINLGAVVALLPLTGIPLPFISYGGSNLIISFLSIGIMLNLSKTS